LTPSSIVLWVEEDLLLKHVQVKPSAGEATKPSSMVLWVEEDILPEHVHVKPSTGEATK
jgi:hypothetical protein